MKIQMIAGLALVACVPVQAQLPDMALAEKWGDVTVVHYEVVGVNSDKHVQIPPTDADMYGDVEETVTLSFDWDKNSKQLVGAATITNHSTKVSNLVGMGPECPSGEMNGAYEHFDVVELKPNGVGAIELIGVRKHPVTMVAESCGQGRSRFEGADEAVSTWIGPPDPVMLAFAAAMGPDSPITLSADGQSMIMTALNDTWVWTYTPSVK